MLVRRATSFWALVTLVSPVLILLASPTRDSVSALRPLPKASARVRAAFAMLAMFASVCSLMALSTRESCVTRPMSSTSPRRLASGPVIPAFNMACWPSTTYCWTSFRTSVSNRSKSLPAFRHSALISSTVLPPSIRTFWKASCFPGSIFNAALTVSSPPLAARRACSVARCGT